MLNLSVVGKYSVAVDPCSNWAPHKYTPSTPLPVNDTPPERELLANFIWILKTPVP